MSRRLRLTCLTALLVAAAAAPASASAVDWGERLAADARAFHAALATSHPGPVDPEHPAFAPLLDDSLARALSRVPETRDFAGYWWALREFQAAFDDGHVQLRAGDDAPSLPARWPGFLTRWNGRQHVVALRRADPALPAVGARLLDCDDQDADALAADRVGRFHGNWGLDAQRVRHGGQLFVDTGNPWATLPRHCRFAESRSIRSLALHWQPITAPALDTYLARTRPIHRTSTGLQTTADGQLWISAASFNAASDSPHFAALTALLGALEDPARIGQAARVVLDVRGNGGGSSHWSREIAARLWGDAAIEALPGGAGIVDWRVSQANLDAIRGFGAMLQAQDAPDPTLLRWVAIIDTGITGALAQGDALWRLPPEAEDPPSRTRPRPRVLAADARVYVLADAACASACLDALDLWLPLGAVLVGGETSADTVYMEVRDETLPSGLATIGIPMKVYRDRARGNNQPYRPEHAWPGDFADDAALQAWIPTLP